MEQQLNNPQINDDEIDLVEILNVILSHWKLIVLGSIIPALFFGLVGFLIQGRTYSSQYLYRVPSLKPAEFQLLREAIFSDDTIPGIAKELSIYLNESEEQIVGRLKSEGSRNSLITLDTIPPFDEKKPENSYNMLNIRIRTGKLDDYSALKRSFESEFLYPAFESQAVKTIITDNIVNLQKQEADYVQAKPKIEYNIDDLENRLQRFRKLRQRVGGGYSIQVPTMLSMERDMSNYLPLDQQIIAIETLLLDRRAYLENMESQHQGRLYMIAHLNNFIKDSLVTEQDTIRYIKSIETPTEKDARLREYNYLENLVYSVFPGWRYEYIRVNLLPTVTAEARGLGQKTILVFVSFAFLMVLLAFTLEFYSKNRAKLRIAGLRNTLKKTTDS